MKNWFAWLDLTPGPARWALGLQTALVLMLGIALLITPTERGVYQTMSSGAPPLVTDQALLKVVFADDITEKELRGLLQGIDAQIVAGPSAIGVYTVRVSKADTDVQRAVTGLRAQAKVRLVEEVQP